MDITTGIILFGILAAIIIGIVVKSYLEKRKKKDEEDNIDVKPDISGRKPIKRALIVGINKYKPELNADLNGCVNDAENMRSLLITKFGFNADNIRILVDERATKANILERLQWLVNKTAKGDELVFHYSGHGSQVRDRDGDELEDRLDEILCPYDLDWDDPLSDDILGDIFKKLPKGVNLTMICDSCHSGTMTKALKNSVSGRARFLMPPLDIRSRSLGRNLPKRKIGQKPRGDQNHVLASACRDDQTAADAFIDGKYQGAFTWALTNVIRSNPDLSWAEIHKGVTNRLSNSYTQEPQLSGNKNLLERKVFGGTEE